MTQPLIYWAELYRRNRTKALCLDIETTGWNKPISVVGLGRPKDGIPDVIQLVKDQNLSTENLKWALQGCQLLITYNGIHFDLKRIRKEFPGVVPYGIPVLDLFRFAKRCGIRTDLKTLENTFHIERMEESTKRRGIAVKLWRRSQEGNAEALKQLLEYNRQDVINLYPLAEMLTEVVLRPGFREHDLRQAPPRFPMIPE